MLVHPIDKALFSGLITLLGVFVQPLALSYPLSDPTAPVAGWETLAATGTTETGAASEQGLRLQQLIRIDKTWTAVINGQAYQAGDATGLFKVISITDQGATIQQGNQKRRLTLESSAVVISESRSSSVKGQP